MGNETKVGIFVVIGAALLGSAIFLLGDFSFKKYYTIYVDFKDVSGLPDKSVVKLSGVEAGKVKDIYMENGEVVVKVNILKGIEIYKNARFLVGSTSVIGSKFLEIDQGDIQYGLIKDGDRIKGINELPLDKALAELIGDMRELLGDLNGESIGSNLNETMNNLRNITANLNQIISASKPHAENMMEKLDSLTAKLDSILGKTREIVNKINNGEGAVGALMSDKKMKDNIASTVDNLEKATASAKDMLSRITSFKTYFEFGASYEPSIQEVKSDAGIKIYPRENRYYYIGGSNIVNTNNIKYGTNYERINTIDALLGWEIGKFDVYGGAINGSGGVGAKFAPFSNLRKLKFLLEASEFSRDRYIKGRRFNDVKYDAGVEFDLNKYISAGIRINDLLETKRFNYTANLAFEDRDIAYLFGLATFASAGTKARSK